LRAEIFGHDSGAIYVPEALGCGTGEMCSDNASRNFGCASRNPVPVAKSRFVYARRFLDNASMRVGYARVSRQDQKLEPQRG
jgi:hypothetical protein